MQVSFNDVTETSRSGADRLPFFKLNENEVGYVRFVHTPNDVPELYNVHQIRYFVDINGQSKEMFSSVDCLRKIGGPVSDCPFCNSGDSTLTKISQVGLIKVLHYTRDNTGRMVCTPEVWQRTASWIKQNIMNYVNLYQNTTPEKLFMIQRTGKGLDTKYTVTPLIGVPNFSDADYPLPQTNPFEGYELKKNLTCKSAEDMTYFVTAHKFPWNGNNNTVTNVGGQSNVNEFSQITPQPTTPPMVQPQPMQNVGGVIQPNELPFETAPQMTPQMTPIQPMQNVQSVNNAREAELFNGGVAPQPTANPMQTTPWANAQPTMTPIQRRY